MTPLHPRIRSQERRMPRDHQEGERRPKDTGKGRKVIADSIN